MKQKKYSKTSSTYLDAKLNFFEHINEKIKKSVKGISVTKKRNVTLPRSSLLTIYKSFIRPHLGYGDVIYDQPNNNRLSKKIESIRYNATLAITGAVRRTLRDKFYQELGLESLKDRRLLRRLCYLHKVLSTKLPAYLYELIPPVINSHRNPGCYIALYCRTDLLRNSFLPFSINECNKLHPDIKNLDSHEMFRKKLLNFVRSSEKSIFNIYDSQGSKLLSRVRLGFSHLGEHKFQHNFADFVNLLYSCTLETESTDHCFLRCQNYVSFRTALMNELSSINSGIISLRSSALLEVILYGDKMLNDNSNQQILTATINYIKNTHRFKQSFLNI